MSVARRRRAPAGLAALTAAAALVAGVVAGATSAAGAPSGPHPFGLACHPTEVVRYRPGDVEGRGASSAGVPLDVSVLPPPAPARGTDGGYPLVVELHGWAGAKLGLDDDAGGF